MIGSSGDSWSTEKLSLNAGPLPWFASLKRYDGELVLIADWGPCHESNSGFSTPDRYVTRLAVEDEDFLTREHENIRNALRNQIVTILADMGSSLYYIGRSRLAEFSSKGTSGIELVFKLSGKLPKEMWLKVGGYRNWVVNINRKRNILVNNVREINDLFDKHLSGSATIYVTRYEGDVFELFLDHEYAVVSYMDTTSVPFVSSSAEQWTYESQQVLNLPTGRQSFASSMVVGRKVGLKLLKEFLESGKAHGLAKFIP